ncbi:MAG: DUF6515 family protein [Saonia sp.]
MKTQIVKLLFLSLFLVAINSHAQRKNTKTETSITTAKGHKKVSRSAVTYKTPKKRVTAVRKLPNKKVVRHNGQNYYYSNNRYYIFSGGRYTVIAPRIGFRVRTLPIGHRRIIHNNRTYFFFDGVFYNTVDNEYEVIEPEIGTIVYELPEAYERVEIHGQTYYEYANILYKKIQIDGTRAYEVVGLIEIE